MVIWLGIFSIAKVVLCLFDLLYNILYKEADFDSICDIVGDSPI